MLVARSADKLKTLAEEVRRDHGVATLILPNDLADPTAPQAIVDQLATHGVAVDVLVNNAGFGLVSAVSSLRDLRRPAVSESAFARGTPLRSALRGLLGDCHLNGARLAIPRERHGVLAADRVAADRRL